MSLKTFHAVRFPGPRPADSDQDKAKVLEVITTAAFGDWAGAKLNAHGSPSMGYPMSAVEAVKDRIEGQTNAYKSN